MLCFSGTSHQPAEPDGSSWNPPASVLHRTGLYAAAVPTGAAGPRTGSKITAQPKTSPSLAHNRTLV